ncbi:cytochrome [Streptomyces sp. NPDC050504]|uniref:cytochrome n=1 Tax=Streptomyces sp. NPDC050504 TaxID=3365618 RepID=UPI0037B3A475
MPPQPPPLAHAPPAPPRFDHRLGAWTLSRPADVALALTDPRFSGGPAATWGFCRGEGHRADPAGAAAERLAPAVERTAYVLARRIAARPRADLVEEFCRWLPAGAVASACGLGYAELAQARLDAAGPCAARTAPRERALAAFLRAVLAAPHRWGALRADPALVDRAWTDVLRRDPPVRHVLRRTTAEIRLAGATLPAGAFVACHLDPYRFHPAGPADCPAALLARLEAAHGLRALLEAMPGLRLLGRGGLVVRPGAAPA